MKSLEVALCDLDSDYIVLFANHVMDKAKVSVHIFTTPEGFFSDETDFDVTVLTEDFAEVADFRPKGTLGHKYFFSEDSHSEKEDYIYKYQSVDRILGGINELKEVGQASIKKSNETSKLVGIYSPTSHELQLPFAMALGQAYKNFRTGSKVLFIDLEEISIMSNLIGKNCESSYDRNLMDLLYEINTSANVELAKYYKSFMGFDYIEPFNNPNEIGEVDEETWKRLFELLLKSDYDVIVVLFGRAVNGFNSLIEKLNRLYVLGRPGDYFRMCHENFFEYLERIGLTTEVENVILPMSAGNLSDGTYQIEELLQGNLGVFVNKLLKENGRNVKENYV